jgi:hypothetical protein
MFFHPRVGLFAGRARQPPEAVEVLIPGDTRFTGTLPSPPPTAEARALPRRLRHQSIMMILVVNSIDCQPECRGL